MHIKPGAVASENAIFSHMRWLSAIFVALSHIRVNLMQDWRGGPLGERIFYFVTGFGHQGVVIFFVLSGFLVGRKICALAVAEKVYWGKYLIDRFSRIYVVLIPALLFSLAVLTVISMTSFVDARDWSAALQKPLKDDVSAPRWLSVALLVNGLLEPTISINGPLWSLACEWTYYIVALGGVLAWRRIFDFRATLIVLYSAALLAACVFAGQIFIIGGCVWAIGLGCSIMADRRMISGGPIGIALIASVCLILILSRVQSVSDVFLGIPIGLMVAWTGWEKLRFGAAIGHELASFSYSLYVVHFPISLLFAAWLASHGGRLAFSVLNVCVVLGLLAFSLLVAKVFGVLTESKTRNVRGWLEYLLRHRGLMQ